MLSKALYILVVMMGFLSNQAAMADDCLNRRVSFMYTLRSLPPYVRKYNPNAVTNTREVDDVLENEIYNKLCATDQVKFKKIVYSTFRLIRVNDEGDEIGFDGKEIYGTLVGSRTLIVSLPDAKEGENLKIKLINYDEEESLNDYNIFKIIKVHHLGYSKVSTVLLADQEVSKMNPDFIEESAIGLLQSDLTSNYTKFISANGKPKLDMFFLGYDDEDMNMGIGLNTIFEEFWDGKKENVSSYDDVSDNFGGGAYDENFNFIGLHYYNTVHPSMKKLYHVVDALPATISESAISFHMMTENLRY